MPEPRAEVILRIDGKPTGKARPERLVVALALYCVVLSDRQHARLAE